MRLLTGCFVGRLLFVNWFCIVNQLCGYVQKIQNFYEENKIVQERKRGTWLLSTTDQFFDVAQFKVVIKKVMIIITNPGI